VLRVCLNSILFHELRQLSRMQCEVPPPETSGGFAGALRLFDQFLNESDLDAAQQCLDICESLLADFHANMLAHGSTSNSAALPVEHNNAGQPIGSQRQYHILIQLARTLQERYQYAGDARDLEHAARQGEKALAMCRAENTVCPTVWVFYADIIRSSFEVTTDSDRLQMAEMLCRDAISLCVPLHPLNSTICHVLSCIYLLQFGQNGDDPVIDEAERLQRLALERLPETESHNRARHLRRLADVLTRKHYHGEHRDKDDILSICSEASRLCPSMHVDRCLVQRDMMWQLLVKYIRSGELEFLNRSIELGRETVDMGDFPNPSRRASFLYRMAQSLQTRYARAGTNEKDLEESVELIRTALQITSLSHVNHWVYVRGLAEVLILQFLSDGDMRHLEEASQLYHSASHGLSKGSPLYPMVISSFGNSLGLRFRETGYIAELNRAIDLDKEAVAALHPSAVNYSNFTVQMVSHLCLRFEVLHENNDLEKAIRVAEELLRSVPNADIERIGAIAILAKARLLHAIEHNSSVDIDLAIEQLLSIKDELSRSSLGPENLRTLAACYMVKFRHSSAVDAALHAKDVTDGVLESVDSSHYERFQCLVDAAKLYMEHGTPYQNIDTALKHLSEALGNTHRDVRSKIRGAKGVLDKMEIDNHNLFSTTSSMSLKLLDIMETVVLLLPRIAFFGIHPYSRLQSLKEGQTIAMTGASHALNLSLPEKALEIMEQGRAIFWTHTLRLRSPFDDIPNDLRDRLFSLARRLEKASNASESSADQQYIDRQIAQRRKDSEQFDSLVQQVRCLSGLERFMLPDDYSTLKGVADKGPVVVLVSSNLACHAILLKSSGYAASIPLKSVTDKWLVDSSSVWRSTVMEARSAMRDGRKLIKSKKGAGSSYMRAERILRLLWTNVVVPVIQALQLEVGLRIIHLEYHDSNI
jgi:tetratricopeptide (TPR) repeat protein